MEAYLNGKKIGNVVNEKKVKLLKQDSIDIHLIFQSDAQQILTLFNFLGFLWKTTTFILNWFFEGTGVFV